MNKLFSKHTGQPVDKVERDSDRDFYMSAEEAKKYGIVDEVVESLKETPGRGGGDLAAREERP
jgi:ATP-dependent Clp protease protease subunit